MPIAALYGTTIGYTDYFDTIVLEKTDGRVAVPSRRTFEYLYFRLDEFRAALKEDCIEYVMNDPITDVYEQPRWYSQLWEDGVMRGDCGMDIFYPESGEEILINPRSVILRNFLGQLKYMEYEEFIKYYDIPGSEFIE